MTEDAPFVRRLIKALRNKDGIVRQDAANALGKIGDERAVEPLIKALRDKDFDVRDYAIKALETFGDERAVEPLIKLLASRSRSRRQLDSKLVAAKALGTFGDLRAIEPLIKALEDAFDKPSNWSFYIAEAVMKALGEIGDARAVEPLIKALEGSEDMFGVGKPQRLAAYALGKIGDVRAVEPLIGMLSDDGREAAVVALNELGWVPETDEQRAAYLIASRAWESLAEWGEPAVEPLIRVLSEDDKWNRKSAAVAFGKIGDKRAVEPLIKTLGNEDEYVRDATMILEKFGEPAVELLIEALGSDSYYAPQECAMVLAKIDNRRAMDALIEKSQKGNIVFQVLTIELLKKELVKRGLPVSGTKNTLIQRLKGTLEKEE